MYVFKNEARFIFEIAQITTERMKDPMRCDFRIVKMMDSIVLNGDVKRTGSSMNLPMEMTAGCQI